MASVAGRVGAYQLHGDHGTLARSCEFEALPVALRTVRQPVYFFSPRSQTNFLALARIVGTAFGAGVALVTFKAFARLPLALTLTGAAFSTPCFWLAITRVHAIPWPFDRTTLTGSGCTSRITRQVRVSPYLPTT